METAALFGENATVVFRCAGRLRIQAPALYRSEPEKRRIEAALAGHEGIDAVHANPLTGRILILFRCSVPVERILVALGLMPSPPADTAADDRRSMPAAPPAPSARPLHDIYPPWHLREANDALAFHGSSPQSGLPAAVAQERLRAGRNLLPQPRARSSVEILLGQFRSLPVLLLGASALLAAATGGLAEALAIGAVLVLNAGIGFATERRAETTIASLSELVDDIAPVLRDGRYQEVHASEIVPGDLLALAPGVRIAADARLVQADGVAVDESALTGESRFVRKSTAALRHPVPMADRINIAYMGTSVATGTGLAVVVGTGRNTEIGIVQSLMNRTAQPKTPLQQQLDRLGNQLVAASLGVCVAVFALGLLRGIGWLQMLKSSISLAIAAVPEGLPTVATTSLARGIRLMKQKHMLVRRLQAVETLGAIHTICLDKTGTLTMNRMSAVEVRLDTAHYAVVNGTLRLHGRPARADADADLVRLLQICVLCNENEAMSNGAGGSATETALIELARGAGLPVEDMRARHPLLHAELRTDDRSYMTAVRELPGADRRLIAVKGSPAEVLALCTHCLSSGRDVALDPEHRVRLMAQNRRMARRQLRVLAFAYAETAAGGAPDAGLTWVGLVGLADPLRAGAEAVIEQLHRAGIRTTMVTGDQKTTALAIGKSLHLNNGRPLHVLESDHLERIAPQILKRLVEEADIFARVSPACKLEIVRSLQDCGEVVAMTGDGINDGPALQASNVGIAMGLHGTDLARSAADVVLEDDRLETVLEAIREGRTLTVNIRKALHFLISSNMSEIMAMLGAIVAGKPPPLSPMQLLWVNLLGDVLPAIALGAEPAEDEVMRQKPRDASRPLIGEADLKQYAREGLFLSGGTLAAYFFGLARHGPGVRAGEIAFNALMLGQLLHALSCRSDRPDMLAAHAPQANGGLDLSVAASAGLQVLANFVPGLRRLLGTEPMGMTDIAAALAGAGVPLLINEAAKRTPRADAALRH